MVPLHIYYIFLHIDVCGANLGVTFRKFAKRLWSFGGIFFNISRGRSSLSTDGLLCSIVIVLFFNDVTVIVQIYIH